MSRLDIVAFRALDADRHLLRVSNADLLGLVRERLAPRLDQTRLELYEKLLRGERSRYVAADHLGENLADDHAQRYARFRERCARLARTCVRELVDDVELPASRIGCVVTNTTVGGMMPNLSSVVANELGLAPATRVVDLGYMGCATALLALEIAEQQLRPGEFGLVVSVELTSVMTNLLAERTESLVANTVFGDGVGAFLVAKRPYRRMRAAGLPALRVLEHAGSVHTDGASLAAITYEPNRVYHEIRLNDGIGEAAQRGVRSVLETIVRNRLASSLDKLRWLWRRELPPWQRRVDFALLHTAGSRVLEGIVSGLGLSEEQAGHNMRAFLRYGNTSSASLYYVLHELLRARSLGRGQRLLFLSYGSGFLTRGLLAEVVE